MDSRDHGLFVFLKFGLMDKYGHGIDSRRHMLEGDAVFFKYLQNLAAKPYLGVHPGFLIKFGALLQHTVADKGIYHQGIAIEKVTIPLLDMEFGVIANDYIIQKDFQITQLNLHGDTVVLVNEFANLLLAGDVDMVDDNFFDASIQVGDSLMDDVALSFGVT